MNNAMRERKAVREDLFQQFVEWQIKKDDFETLIDEAVEALSPAQLIDEYPLNRMSEENQSWLKEVIHILYMERTGIKTTVGEIREKFNYISEFHALLLKILKGENDELKKKAGKQPFEGFYKELQKFSKMISSLPHEVQVV